MTRLSLIKEDVSVIVGSYGSPIKDQVYHHTIRGKTISKLPNCTKEVGGRKYQLAVMPDFTQQWVNVDNIRSFKLTRFAGGIK